MFDFLDGMSRETRSDIGDAMSAIGAGLMTGNRYKLFGPGFQYELAQQSKNADLHRQREGLRMVLKQARPDLTDDQLEAMASDPATAKLALQNIQDSASDALAAKYVGIGAPAPVSNLGMGAATPMRGELSLTGPIGQQASAIQSIESSGRYDALGPKTKTGDQALGAYQVMASNLPSWSKEALGRELTSQEFLSSPQAQDQVFAHRFGGYVQKFGTPQDAASAWFTGRPLAEGANRRDQLGTSGSQYVDRFNRALAGLGGEAGGVPTGQPAAAPVQVADASGKIGGLPRAVAGVSPAREPVQVAENEADVQRLEQQTGMVPAGAAPAPQRVAQNTADLPVDGAQPVGFTVPGTGEPIMSLAQARAENNRRLAQRRAFEQQYRSNEQGIASLSRFERHKGTVDLLKGRNEDLRKKMDGLDAAPDGYERDPQDPRRVRPITGGPKDIATIRAEAEARSIDRTKLVDDARQREEIAQRNGFQPGSPEYQSYVTTGKLPKEERQGLSASDRKAVMSAEDALPEIDSTIETLSRAKDLNGQTFTGVTAGTRGWVGTSIPGAGLVLDPKASAATREFGQLMSMEAIKSMSQTLKGATTDREMARFMDILGDPATPPDIRGRTLDRMLTLAQRQKAIAVDRVNELRGGTYYQPGGGASGAARASQGERQSAERQSAPAAVPSAAVEALRADPSLRGQFDAKYGPGASTRVLGGR